MKKFIAYLLLLAMCVSVFAGCTKPEEKPNGLESAKTYLYNLYKDAPEVTADDFTRVGIVKIQDVGTYTVTWTSSTDAVVVGAMGEDKMVPIDVPASSTEEIAYTLTATIADEAGNTATVTFNHKILASGGFPDGTYVIVTGNLTFSSLAEDKSYGYPYANEVTVADGKVSGHFKADVLTLTNIGEDGVTIQDAYGRYFYMKDSYNSFNVSEEAPAEGHIWKILQVEGGYQLVNTWNQKTLAYSTGYSSWGAYPELDDSYQSVLTIIAATAPEKDPEVEVDLGVEPDTNITIEQAVNAATITGNRETEGKYYITGVITEIKSDVYGNFYIEDETGSIYVYGCYDADGTNRYDAMATKPQVGDTVTLYGVLMSYNDAAQMKNAWVTAHTPGEGAPETKPTEPETKPTEPETKPTEPETEPATQPEVSGKGYNIYANNGTVTLWFKGTITNGRFDAAATAADAVTVYLENVDGGVLIYFLKGSEKTYIVMNDESTGGDLTTSASEATVFAWNADLSTYMVADPDNARAFGAQEGKSYMNFSAYATSNTSGYYWGQFLEAGTTPPEGGTTTPTEPETAPDDNTGSNENIATDVTLTDGMKVVIYAPAFGKAFSSTQTGYYQNGVDVTVKDGKLTGYTDAEVWTVKVNSDGTYSFSMGGKNIGMGAEYSSMSLGAANDTWQVISVGNGLYNIKNVGRGNIIDWYADKGNWSTYTSEKAATDPAFQLAFYVVK